MRVFIANFGKRCVTTSFSGWPRHCHDAGTLRELGTAICGYKGGVDGFSASHAIRSSVGTCNLHRWECCDLAQSGIVAPRSHRSSRRRGGGLFSAMIIAIYVGLQWTTAGRVIVFVYTAPIFVALGGAVFLPDQRLRVTQWLGMAMALVGVSVETSEQPAGGRGMPIIGDALALTAGFTWAATTLLIRTSRLRSAALAKVFLYQFGVSGLVLTCAALLFGESIPRHLAATTLISFLYQTLWIACGTYLIWFHLIAKYNIGELSSFTFLTPIFGVAAGYLILGDPLSARFLIGAGLVVTGIGVVNLPATTRAKNQQGGGDR
jgi:drug/metabolite transporter (DMT)-like permease